MGKRSRRRKRAGRWLSSRTDHFSLQSGPNHLFGQLNLEARAARARHSLVLQESNSTLRLCIKVRKTIFKSTLRTVDAVESVSYCVQQDDGKSSRSSTT